MPTIVPIDLPAAYWREKAQRAHRAGQYAEAVRLYRAALRKNDDNSVRCELAQVFSDMHSFSVSNLLYLENLALDTHDTDSLYGLARNYSLMGDENAMADLLDLYLRMAPCGAQADTARDILWRMPRPAMEKSGKRRARTLYYQALDRSYDMESATLLAKKAWKRGKLPETAQLLSELYLRKGKVDRALELSLYACENRSEDMNARLLLAACMFAGGMKEGCRAALSQAMQRCETHEQAALFCHQALMMNNIGLAVKLMEKRAEKFPGSTETLLRLALMLRQQGGAEERVQRLLQTVVSLDEEDVLAKTLLEAPAHPGGSPAQYSARVFERMCAQLKMDERADEDPDVFYREIRRVLRISYPGLREAVVSTLIHTHNERAMRLALVQEDMPSHLCAMILQALEEMGAALPCFARVEGRVCLLPPRERPPYDADLHALIRQLLRDMHGEAPLSVFVHNVPSVWRNLPESARKHYAKEKDDVWLSAFAAYVHLCAGHADAAEERIAKSSRPLRTGRAYMQLIRRTKNANEVH